MNRVLDMTAGGRQMWFNKSNPCVIYGDKYRREPGCINQQPNFSVLPDVTFDFVCLPFRENVFNLVVFDPPHAFISTDSILGLKYGTLNKDTWREDIRMGFKEGMRVLKPGGSLILKWGEVTISIKELLGVLGEVPLFGHTTAKSGKTKWMCFIKEDEDD